MDGSGYPEGIRGDELSLEVRVVGLCDIVEVMSSHRPYRAPRKKEEVIGEIEKEKGVKYDPEVADTLLEIIKEGEIEEFKKSEKAGR